jgi:hypothetical protein
VIYLEGRIYHQSTPDRTAKNSYMNKKRLKRLKNDTMSENILGKDTMEDTNMQVDKGEANDENLGTEENGQGKETDPLSLEGGENEEPPTLDAQKEGNGGVLDLHDLVPIPEQEGEWEIKMPKDGKVKKGKKGRPGYDRRMEFEEILEYKPPAIFRLVDNTKRHAINTLWSSKTKGIGHTIKTAKAYSIKRYWKNCNPESIDRLKVQSMHPVGFRQDHGEFSTKLIFILMDINYGPIFVNDQDNQYSPFEGEDLKGIDGALGRVHPILGPTGKTEYVIERLPHNGYLVEYPITIVTTNDQGPGKIPEWIHMIINVTKEEMNKSKPRTVGKQDEHPGHMFRLLATTPNIMLKYGINAAANFFNVIPPEDNKENAMRIMRNGEKRVNEDNWRRRGEELESNQHPTRPNYQSNLSGGYYWNDKRGRSVERHQGLDREDMRPYLRNQQSLDNQSEKRYGTNFVEMVLNQEDNHVRQLFIDSAEWLMMHLIHLSAKHHDAFTRKMRMDYMNVAGCCCNVCLKKYTSPQTSARLEQTNYSDVKYQTPKEGENME